jgi:hypothetical protein
MAAVLLPFLHPDARLIQTNALTGNLPVPHGAHYTLLGIWERFDTLWFLHIAEHGYDQPMAVIFYPLYPLAIRSASWALPPIIAALLVSAIATFFFFWGLLRLAGSKLADSEKFYVLLLVLVWPSSFVLLAGYADSLTLALVVWTVIFAREGRWGPATVCGLLAGVSRPTGVLVSIPLFVLGLRSRCAASLAVVLAPMGMLSYWGWLRWSGHTSVIESYRLQQGMTLVPPWTGAGEALRLIVSNGDTLLAVKLVIVILFAALSMRREVRTEDKLFALAVILQMMMYIGRPLLATDICCWFIQRLWCWAATLGGRTGRLVLPRDHRNPKPGLDVGLPELFAVLVSRQSAKNSLHAVAPVAVGMVSGSESVQLERSWTALGVDLQSCVKWCIGTQRAVLMKKGRRSGRPITWIHLLFFCSGFPALIYQIVWQRALFAVYGLNIESVTIVVSGFMLGLGLGSLVGGKLSNIRRFAPVKLFALAELFTGIFGIVSLKLFHRIAEFTAGKSPLEIRLIGFFVIVLSTLLMGATLPLLVEYSVRSSQNVGSSVGGLYYANCLGSGFACFLASGWLMRYMGQSDSVRFAAALNVLVALGALVYYL